MNVYFNFFRIVLKEFLVCGKCDYIKINLFRRNNNFISHQSRIINKYKPSVLLDPTAKIEMEGTLTLNEDYPKGSMKKSVLILNEMSNLIVRGHFKVFYDAEICLYEGAQLSLGYGYINAGAQIRCMEKITIGDQCAIGRNVMIMDYDAHKINYEDGTENDISKPIKIGRHVWIGAGAAILKGVTIGDNAVIGAGSVVTKDVASNTVVAGCPAKIKRKNIEWR